MFLRKFFCPFADYKLSSSFPSTPQIIAQNLSKYYHILSHCSPTPTNLPIKEKRRKSPLPFLPLTPYLPNPTHPSTLPSMPFQSLHHSHIFPIHPIPSHSHKQRHSYTYDHLTPLTPSYSFEVISLYNKHLYNCYI